MKYDKNKLFYDFLLRTQKTWDIMRLQTRVLSWIVYLSRVYISKRRYRLTFKCENIAKEMVCFGGALFDFDGCLLM